MLYIFLLLLVWFPPCQSQPSPDANQTLTNVIAYRESLLTDPPTPSHFNQSEFPLTERIHTIMFSNGTNIGNLILGKTMKVHENISAYFQFKIQKDQIGVFTFSSKTSTVTHSIFAKTTEKVQWLTVNCGIIMQHTFGNRIELGEENEIASNRCQTEKIVLVALTNTDVSGEINLERLLRVKDFTYVFLIIILVLTGLGYYLLWKICEPEEETDEEKLEKVRSLLENYNDEPVFCEAGTQTKKEDDKKYLHILLIVLLFLTGLGWLLDNRSRIQTDRIVTNSSTNDSSAFFWNSFKAEVSSLEVHVPPRSENPLVQRIHDYKWPNGTKIDDLLIGKKIEVQENITASAEFQLKKNQIGVFAFNKTISSFTERFFVNTTDQTLWLFVKCGTITDYVVSNKKQQDHIELNVHFAIKCRGSHFTVIAVPKTSISGSIFFGPTSPFPYVAYAIILLTIIVSTNLFELVRDFYERYQRRKRIMKMGLNGLLPNTDPAQIPSKVETLEQFRAMMDQQSNEGDDESDRTIHIVVWISDAGNQTDFEEVKENRFWDKVSSWLKKDKKPLDATIRKENGIVEDDDDQFYDALSCFSNEALATPDLSLN